MTTKPEESEASIAQAIARCEAAQAAYDAAHDDDDAANQLSAAESDAIEILAETPCASDAAKSCASSRPRNSDIWAAGLQPGVRSHCCRCQSSLYNQAAGH
jgi:hypothetical protein